MRRLEGIPVSAGVVIGRVFALDDQRQRIPRRHVPRLRIPQERERLARALDESRKELEATRTSAEASLGSEAAKIFNFHLGMLADRSLTRPMDELIEKEAFVAEYAVFDAFQKLEGVFAKMPDPAFRTKVDDVRDLRSRVLKHLIGEHRTRLDELHHEGVVIARDLTPSQAAAFDRNKVVAFATDLGGKTSHTAILARALAIPAVVGCHDLTGQAEDGQTIIVDGDHGVVLLDPDEAEVARYRAIIERQKTYRLSLEELCDLPSVTRDGVHVQVQGNIEFPEEITTLRRLGGEGVGLYRTEFLYLTGPHEPSEEDHYKAYSRCVELLQGRPLTIRTMDLGADKYTQERAETPERNPFLGLRSIRYCLDNPAMFRRQLRAILRASAEGPIRVMFPLVTTLGELRRARWILKDLMDDLQEEGVPFDPGIPIGMMVEVPAAAIQAAAFAREVDFFSIGTNDLVQYTLAVDRTNERVANLFNPANPAVLRLIRETARAGDRARIPVSCCGESASDPDFAVLLLGLGVHTLSVNSGSVPQIKRLVRSVSAKQCEHIAKRAMSFDSDVEVAGFLRDQTRRIIPEAFDGRSAE